MASTSTSVDFPAASPSHLAIDDSDLDPAAFLKSVRELSEKREKEDAERFRRLEEEIEQGRLERAKRREERARSISPVKNATPASASVRTPTRTVEATRPTPPSPAASSLTNMDASTSASDDIPDFQGFGSHTKSTPTTQSTHTPTESPASKPAPTASSLARSGTLSWQQRPKSRAGGSRPQSVISLGSAQGRDTPADDPTPSRDQIAASLGSRDPAWFKQTAERGVGNAAFRKSKDDDVEGHTISSSRRGLPGLSRESSINPSRGGSPAPPAEDPLSDSGSRGGFLRQPTTASGGSSLSRSSVSGKPDLKSLIAADAEQETASPHSTSSIPPSETAGLGRPVSMSSTQARLTSSIERPPSPTKGMGGFVQSAMLKRSDSVNKRWSAQPGPSLSRQNSVASSRGAGLGGLTGSHSMPRLEPTPASRETSNEPLSRPGSSSSTLTSLTAGAAKDREDVFAKPSRPTSVSTSTTTKPTDRATSPPPSPSKRWSPTKSTWLESAITRPDSPKPAAPRNSQPSWMADIAKAKAQRASVDITPKPEKEDPARSRSASPTKAAFGQGLLKRSQSRDLGLLRSAAPKAVEELKGGLLPRSSSEGVNLLRREERGRALGTLELAGEEKESGMGEGRRSLLSSPQPVDTKASPKVSTPDMEGLIQGEIMTAQSQNQPTERTASDVQASSIKSPPMPNKSKPETPPKPQTDFRSTLRSRAAPDAKQQDTPEFLAKFGNLRKTQTQNYVAPDLLKGNILRGKADLSKSGGPVKTVRRDELKESLLAKKDQWKKDKEDGVVHERKISGPAPQTPQKPEALTRRELMGRSESFKQSPEKPKTATPEALVRHKSLREKVVPASLPVLEKQVSEPAVTGTDLPTFSPKKQTSTPIPAPATKQPTETSRLAAKFNPGLAGILARGPPAASTSNTPSRSESPVVLAPMSLPSEPAAEGGQLVDMRKGRAKGPKRRKGGVQESAVDVGVTGAESPAVEEEVVAMPVDVRPVEKAKPRAPVGSAAALMLASLEQKSGNAPSEPPSTPLKGPTKGVSPFPSSPAAGSNATPATKPVPPTKSPLIGTMKLSSDKPLAPAKSPSITKTPITRDLSSTSQKADVPDFKGFGSIAASQKPHHSAPRLVEDDKENVEHNSSFAKAAVQAVGRSSPAKRQQPPTKIEMPSQKDEEAAMRSAGLLASSPLRPGSRDGLGIALGQSTSGAQTPVASPGLPPKPVKSSRAVSGQLQEASPNKGPSRPGEPTSSETRQLLVETFGSVPRSTFPLSIDTPAVIASSAHQDRVFRTLRKTVQTLCPDGTLKQLPPHEEYLFFDESVYVCTHSYTVADGPKKSEIFVWSGESTAESSTEQAQTAAKKLAREVGNAFVSNVRQGFEPPGFLQAIGGILVTRRGAREGAPKQYMLCGRHNLGQIVFDEVDFDVKGLCSGYAYLISYPVTLQETRLYLWKGSGASTEEVGAARLAAMDLSETGEIIEVDDGAEFSSFLKIFGAGTTKSSIPQSSELWKQKAQSPSQFSTRLFRIQPTETKTGMFTNIFTRRPSWNNLSPSRNKDETFRAEAKEISPFTQSDMDADCIYVLDAFSQVHVLVGPVFASRSDGICHPLFAQAILFASEYAVLAASGENRPCVPQGSVVFAGFPDELKMLFRHWDEGSGLWGTGGLMAG